jgi:histone-lysine N-methyltransferase SETMAR
LKQVPKNNNRSFGNIITSNETWVPFFEPNRKIHNKIWATKGSHISIKRTMSVKNVMYVICFTNQGSAIQIVVPMGKSVNGKFYKRPS